MAKNTRTAEETLETSSAYLAEIEALAVRLAREAGLLLLEHFHQPLDVEYKRDNPRDPVTVADTQTEEFLRGRLRREAPDHGIVAEEGENQGDPHADFAWVIDPLDGTSNFVNRLPFWACSIGVLYRGRPVVGAIFTPSVEKEEGTVYHARRGGGAFQDDVPISLAQHERPNPQCLISLPSSHWRNYRILRPLQGRAGIVRSTGSIAYELASTATGVFQFGLFGPSSVWDVGAGLALVQEAGGKALARRGQDWVPLETLGQSRETDPSLESLKKWRSPVLVGNPQIVDFVAANLRPRPRYWFRLRRFLRERWGLVRQKDSAR